MRWRKTFLAEVNEKLIQLGLTSCTVCGSEKLQVHSLPSLALMGGLPRAITSRHHDDAEVDTDMFIRIECGTCGYVMFFNAEKFRTGDEEIFIKGLTAQQEEDLERQSPL